MGGCVGLAGLAACQPLGGFGSAVLLFRVCGCKQKSNLWGEGGGKKTHSPFPSAHANNQTILVKSPSPSNIDQKQDKPS